MRHTDHKQSRNPQTTMKQVDIWTVLEENSTEQLRTFDEFAEGTTVVLSYGKPFAHGSRSIEARITDVREVGKELRLESGETTLRAYCDRTKPVLEVSADENGDFGGSIGRISEIYGVDK